MVTVATRDVGEVKSCYRRYLGYKWQLKDGIEEWIKGDGGME